MEDDYEKKYYEVVDILRTLIGDHFYNKSLEWQWQEGCNLQEQDFALYLRICTVIPEVVLEK